MVNHSFVRDPDAFVVDEPPNLLGTDTAPNPSEAALAALGSCIDVSAGFTAVRVKTTLKGDAPDEELAELCRRMGDEFEIAAVTNDIFTREDAEFLQKAAVLPKGRVVGADLSVMDHDAGALRGEAPTLFTSVLHGDGMDAVVGWVREAARHRRWTAATSTARPDHHHEHPR